MNPVQDRTKPTEQGRIEGGDQPRVSEPETMSRVSIVETLYYHTRGINPHVVQTRYGRSLHTEEQAFVRRLTLTTEWTALDPGWLKSYSYLLIQNMEGRMLQTNPTPDERADTASRIVDISFGSGPAMTPSNEPRDMHSQPVVERVSEPMPHLFLSPSESIRLCPVKLEGLKLRCRNKTAKIVLHVIPG